MTEFSKSGRILFAVGITVLLALNAYTFVAAIPESQAITPGINTSGSPLAKDFSAYYVGAWRLWNNPAQIYHFGALGGAEPAIQPYPEAYKYLPSFLGVVSPLLSLSYEYALTGFSIFQFLLLPLMAFLLYRLLNKKGFLVTFAVAAIALLLPFPAPNGGFSLSYYWQWAEGQAKVLCVFLLLLSFYFGGRGKPFLSGVALALGFFDPRFGLLALPLFIMYNHSRLKPATFSLIISLILTNVVLVVPGIWSGFVGMVLNSAVTTPLYYYSLIPFLTLVAMIFVNFKQVIAAFDYFGVLSRFTGFPKEHEWKGFRSFSLRRNKN